jgi:hypothetical protein
VLGDCPNVAFGIQNRLAFTTPATQFRKGRCTDLQFGTRVKLVGRLTPIGTVQIERIEIDRDDDDDDDDE